MGFEHDRRRGRMKGVRKGVAVDRWQDGFPSKTDVGNRKQAAKPRMSQIKTFRFNLKEAFTVKKTVRGTVFR